LCWLSFSPIFWLALSSLCIHPSFPPEFSFLLCSFDCTIRWDIKNEALSTLADYIAVLYPDLSALSFADVSTTLSEATDGTVFMYEWVYLNYGKVGPTSKVLAGTANYSITHESFDGTASLLLLLCFLCFFAP
jgi:hypothetical protein